jgi:hypothetical protein
MSDDDGMLCRDLIQIAHVERALVFQLGIVLEVALDPRIRRERARRRLQLVDDALDSDEFDFEGMPAAASPMNSRRVCAARMVWGPRGRDMT